MAELGIQPIMVDEAVAAAACGFRLERFRAECPLKAVQEGHQRLVPLDEVRAWALNYWRLKTGTGAANDSGAPGAEYWDKQLEDDADED